MPKDTTVTYVCVICWSEAHPPQPLDTNEMTPCGVIAMRNFTVGPRLSSSLKRLGMFTKYFKAVNNSHTFIEVLLKETSIVNFSCSQPGHFTGG